MEREEEGRLFFNRNESRNTASVPPGEDRSNTTSSFFSCCSDVDVLCNGADERRGGLQKAAANVQHGVVTSDEGEKTSLWRTS